MPKRLRLGCDGEASHNLNTLFKMGAAYKGATFSHFCPFRRLLTQTLKHQISSRDRQLTVFQRQSPLGKLEAATFDQYILRNILFDDAASHNVHSKL